MERFDNSWMLVCLAVAIAGFFVWARFFHRKERSPRAEKRSAGAVSLTPPPAPASLTGVSHLLPSRLAPEQETDGELTVRDLRERQAEEAEEAGDCVVKGCRDEAVRPWPVPVFVLGRPASLLSILNSIVDLFSPPRMSAEVPVVWSIVPMRAEAPTCLCATHHMMAVSALAEKATSEQARIASFFSERREGMVEFTGYELLEHLDGVQARMLRGGRGEESKS